MDIEILFSDFIYMGHGTKYQPVWANISVLFFWIPKDTKQRQYISAHDTNKDTKKEKIR